MISFKLMRPGWIPATPATPLREAGKGKRLLVLYFGRGIRTRTDAATSPNIAIYVVSTYCATETTETAQKYVDLKKHKVGRLAITDRGIAIYTTQSLIRAKLLILFAGVTAYLIPKML